MYGRFCSGTLQGVLMRSVGEVLPDWGEPYAALLFCCPQI